MDLCVYSNEELNVMWHNWDRGSGARRAILIVLQSLTPLKSLHYPRLISSVWCFCSVFWVREWRSECERYIEKQNKRRRERLEWEWEWEKTKKGRFIKGPSLLVVRFVPRKSIIEEQNILFWSIERTLMLAEGCTDSHHIRRIIFKMWYEVWCGVQILWSDPLIQYSATRWGMNIKSISGEFF